MKVRIEIDTKTFVRFWLVVVGFAFGILAIYSARTALIILGTAFFLALALNKPVNFLASHLPGKSRVAGTATAYILVVAILAVFAFLVVPPIVEQTVKFTATVPGLVDKVAQQSQGFSEFIDKYHIRPQVDQAVEAAKNNTAHWASSAGQNIISGLGSVFSTAAAILLVLVLSFLMLVEGPAWQKRIWNIYNDEERMESHRELAHRMYNVVTGYVTGQLTVSAIGSTLAGLAVFIISFFFNVPANLALPTVAIAFILSLIPMFGATISGVLIALLLSFNDLPAGLVFAVYFVIYQQIENNFISPTIQSRKVELSALAVLASVTVGLYVFGIAGGIISIPVAGCLKVLLEDYLAKARKNRIKSEKPLTKLVKKLQGEDS
jgi:predicted PurR-regulated permease PerM